MKRHEIEVVRTLKTGDLVLFGSAIAGHWLLDTVLVVQQRLRRAPIGDPAYNRCVRQPLLGEGIKHLQPTAGRPWAKDAMTYSFCPVQSDTIGTAPTRVDISHILATLRKKDETPPSPKNAQSLVTCSHPRGPDTVWRDLSDTVVRNGMKLGITFTFPTA
jgi:hypothetical protein